MAEGMRFDVDRAGGKPTDEAILNIFHARRDECLEDHQKFLRSCSLLYNFYHGIYKGAGSFRNDVHIPIISALLWADVAYKAQITFGEFPYIGFRGGPPEAGPIAAKNELLVSQQLDALQIFEKAIDFYASSEIYGIGWWRTGWKFDIDTDDITRERLLGMEFEVSDSNVVFDGPDGEPLNPDDVLTEAGKRRLRDCQYVFIRYTRDLDSLRDENKAAKDRGLPPPWSEKGLKELEDRGMSSEVSSRIYDRQHVFRNAQQFADRASRTFSKPVEMWEMWGYVPSEASVHGSRNIKLVVGNDFAVLALTKNPMGKRLFPLSCYTPMPDGRTIQGVSKVRLGLPLAAAAMRLLNNKLDVMDLFVSPSFIVNDQLQLNSDTWIAKPGRLFKASFPGAISDAVMPLQPDLRGVQLAGLEIEQLMRFIEQGLGVTRDSIAGFAGQKGETARGAMFRREGAQRRLSLEAALAEKMWLEPLCNQIRRFNRRFLTLPKEISIIGSAAIMNPTTGLPYPPEPQIVDLEDVNAEFYAYAVGAFRGNKEMRAEKLLAAQQQMQSNPAMFQAMNWVNFGREVLRSLDLDPGQMLNTDISMFNVLAQQLAGGGITPGMPGMFGGEGSSTLEQLEPQLLGSGQQTSPLAGAEMGGLGGFIE